MGISLLGFQLEGGREPSPLSLQLGQTFSPPGKLETLYEGAGRGTFLAQSLRGNPRGNGPSGSTLEVGVHRLSVEP